MLAPRLGVHDGAMRPCITYSPWLHPPSQPRPAAAVHLPAAAAAAPCFPPSRAHRAARLGDHLTQTLTLTLTLPLPLTLTPTLTRCAAARRRRRFRVRVTPTPTPTLTLTLTRIRCAAGKYARSTSAGAGVRRAAVRGCRPREERRVAAVHRRSAWR